MHFWLLSLIFKQQLLVLQSHLSHLPDLQFMHNVQLSSQSSYLILPEHLSADAWLLLVKRCLGCSL